MNFLDPRLPDRFWDKCMPCPMSGCWIWTAATNRDGYGQFRLEPRRPMRRAYRLAYETLVGQVPDGLELDHIRCSTRACCNPAHLKPVTHQQNMRRSPTSLATLNAAKDACPLGHSYDVGCAYDAGNAASGRRCRECRNAQTRARYHAERRKAG